MQYFVSGSFCLDIIGHIHSGFAFSNSFLFFFVIWKEEDTDKIQIRQVGKMANHGKFLRFL